MDTTIQFVFLLILCTQLCYTSGQPPRTGFRLRLSEFDDTLEKATHDQKVKILERLLKNIHEKSKNANPRNSNESPETLDAMKETSTYVDSGEPQLSNIRDGKTVFDLNQQMELGGKSQLRAPSEALTPMSIKRRNSGREKQLGLPEEQLINSFSDNPEAEDCVEDEKEAEALPEPPKFSLDRRPASMGSIDDFPSEARDLASKVFSINNDPNTEFIDSSLMSSLSSRSGAIQFSVQQKKKRCQKKVKEGGQERKGFRSLQKPGKNTYLIIKMP